MAAWKALVGLLGFALLWQCVVWSGAVPPEYLPGVPAIAGSFADQLRTMEFWHNEGLTLLRALTGLLLAIAAGGGAAILGARYPMVSRALSPLVETLRSLPPAALVPLSIFALGLGMPLFLFIISFAGVWTVYVSASNALAASEPVQIHGALTLGYSRWEILWRVRVPAALPEMFSGMRIAAGACLIASVAVEMLAGKDGIGFLLYDTAFALRTADMFALLCVAGFNGVLFNQMVMGTRRLLVGWHDRLTALAQA
jgi:ABC-type nitrate/sulfonate/bicarbonate transport system permease component